MLLSALLSPPSARSTQPSKAVWRRRRSCFQLGAVLHQVKDPGKVPNPSRNAASFPAAMDEFAPLFRRTLATRKQPSWSCRLVRSNARHETQQHESNTVVSWQKLCSTSMPPVELKKLPLEGGRQHRLCCSETVPHLGRLQSRPYRSVRGQQVFT